MVLEGLGGHSLLNELMLRAIQGESPGGGWKYGSGSGKIVLDKRLRPREPLAPRVIVAVGVEDRDGGGRERGTELNPRQSLKSTPTS